MRGRPLSLSAALVVLLGLAACSDTPVTPDARGAPGPTLSVLPAEVEPCGDPLEVDLLAGQHLDVGSVTVANDEDNLYVTYATEGGWTLGATHLEVASSLEAIPTNGAGNPKIGRFTHRATHDGVTEFTYAIPLAELGVEPEDGLVVAAHAEVHHASLGSETAWGEGPRFVERGSWATYLDYTVQACVVVLAPTELCSDHDDDAIATFADPNLEAAVREALGLLADEDITCGDLTLEVLLANRRGIADLAGIQNLTDLRVLGLSGNEISDLSHLSDLTRLEILSLNANDLISDLAPLGGLTNLRQLNLQRNLITDVSPLSGLTALGTLTLGSNEITDVSPLGGLTGLVHLNLEFNPIDDISALSGMTGLRQLGLSATELDDSDITLLSTFTELTDLGLRFNEITDVGPLEGLTKLTQLRLNGNADLADIQPLIDNPGLGSGDFVKLSGTSVPCGQVEELEAKGVTVESDCP